MTYNANRYNTLCSHFQYLSNVGGCYCIVSDLAYSLWFPLALCIPNPKVSTHVGFESVHLDVCELDSLVRHYDFGHTVELGTDRTDSYIGLDEQARSPSNMLTLDGCVDRLYVLTLFLLLDNRINDYR